MYGQTDGMLRSIDGGSGDGSSRGNSNGGSVTEPVGVADARALARAARAKAWAEGHGKQ